MSLHSKIKVDIVRGSDPRDVTVDWTFHGNPDRVQIKLEKSVWECDFGAEKCQIYEAGSGFLNTFQLPKRDLKIGMGYRVTVRALKISISHSSDGNDDSYSVIGKGSAEFRTVFTVADLQRLHQKAAFSCSSSTTCRWLYRNQSPGYFTQIFEHDNGIMKTHCKDNSGDPASPINGQISGLFFMAEVEPGTDGEPCRMSAFGSTRLQVPVRVLLGMAPNLYFADFYCMQGGYHYVTLVATRAGSNYDDFCRKNLLQLSIYDPVNNPFLFQGSDGEMKVAVGTTVELLFTENIDVNCITTSAGAEIKEGIPLIGKGHTTPGGVPKNPNCTTCNL